MNTDDHPVGTWPECEHCFGPGAAVRYHRTHACMKQDPYRTACKPSSINPLKCDMLLYRESVVTCPRCKRYASKVFAADFGVCRRCYEPIDCLDVTEENRAYAKSRGVMWDL